jgi:hypothetical protein
VTKVCSVAELIAHYNRRLPSVRCSLCGREAMFDCGDFSACLICDTNAESRKAAGVDHLV